MKLLRIKVPCKCCGEEKSILVSDSIYGGHRYCDNCNRPAYWDKYVPCDHKPWRKRHKALEEEVMRNRRRETNDIKGAVKP